ncbi:MAG: hypothetical protein AAF960_20005 [Bacteroidota bacterium]
MKNKRKIFALALFLTLNYFVQAQTDTYGGWTAIKAPATGFFSLAEINGRHTFVTPDGHAYYPVGTNHMSAYNNPQYGQIAAFQNPADALERLKVDIAYFNMNAAGGDVPAIVEQHLPFFTN